MGAEILYFFLAIIITSNVKKHFGENKEVGSSHNNTIIPQSSFQK